MKILNQIKISFIYSLMKSTLKITGVTNPTRQINKLLRLKLPHIETNEDKESVLGEIYHPSKINLVIFKKRNK